MAAPPKPAVISFDITIDGREWQVTRNPADPSTGWFFVDKTKKASTWTPPAGVYSPADVLPSAVDKSDPLAVSQQLDEWYLKGHPGVILTRLITREERAAKKRAQDAAPILKAFEIDGTFVPQEAPAEPPFVGSASWTHFSFGSKLSEGALNFPADTGLAGERLHAALATAITHSDPVADGWDANDTLAWHQLVAEIHQSGVNLTQPSLLQRLATLSTPVTDGPAAGTTRSALAHLLVHVDPADAQYAKLLGDVLKSFKGGEAAGKGTADAGAGGAGLALPASAGRPTVSFAESGGAGLASSGSGGATAGQGSSTLLSSSNGPSVPSSLSSIMGPSVPSDADGDDVALGRLVSAFQDSYTPDMGARLLASAGLQHAQPHDFQLPAGWTAASSAGVPSLSSASAAGAGASSSAAAEGKAPSPAEKLDAILAGIANSKAWRRVVMAMLERQGTTAGAGQSQGQGQDDRPSLRPLDDPFLQRFVAAALATGDADRRQELAGTPVVAGHVSFAQSLASDAVMQAVGGATAGIGAGAVQAGRSSSTATAAAAGPQASYSTSAVRSFEPALTSELSALLAADITAAVAASFASTATGAGAGRQAGAAGAAGPSAGVGQTDEVMIVEDGSSPADTTLAAAAAAAVAGLPAPGARPSEPTALFTALRTARARQELSYSILGKQGALTQTGLAAAPADSALLLQAASFVTGTPQTSGPYEAGLRLRRLAMQFWGANRARLEFFPQEGSDSIDASSAAAAILAASSVAAVRPDERPADTGSDLTSASAGEDLVGRELEDRAARAGAVRCISREQVALVARAIGDLSPYFLTAAVYEQHAQQRDSIRAEVQAALAAIREGREVQHTEEQIAAADGDATRLDALLIGHSFALRLLRCPDVLVLLLHVLFHPGLQVDDAGAEAAGAAAGASEAIAQALAWAVSTAGASGERRDRVALDRPEGGARDGSGVWFEQAALPLGDSGLTTPFLGTRLEQGAAAYTGAKTSTTAGAGDSADGQASSQGLDEAASITALTRHLVEASSVCKPGQALQLSLKHGFSATSSVAAITADQTLANAEATLLIRGSAHPIVAAGVLHFARHLLLAPGVYDDAKVLKMAPIYGRMALSLAERWPLLAANTLSLLRACLQLSPPFVDAPALAPCREAVAELLADLACNTGYGLPVLAFVSGGITSGGLETSLGRIFLSRLVDRVASSSTGPAVPLHLLGAAGAGRGGVSATAASLSSAASASVYSPSPSSFSTPFAQALLRLIDGFQTQQRSLAEAMRRPYESILLPNRDVRTAFTMILADIGRLRGVRGATVAEVQQDKAAGYTAEQKDVLGLLAAIEGRVKDSNGVP